MRTSAQRFALVAAAAMAVTGCQTGGFNSYAKSWWPWGKKDKLDTSALASSSPTGKQPALPSAGATPGTTTGSPYGSLASKSATSGSAGGYPDLTAQAAYPPYAAGAGTAATPVGYGTTSDYQNPGTAAAGGYAQSGGYAPAGAFAATQPQYGAAPASAGGADPRYGTWDSSNTATQTSATAPAADSRYGASNTGSAWQAGAAPGQAAADSRYATGPSDASSRYAIGGSADARYPEAGAASYAAPAGGAQYTAQANAPYGGATANSSARDYQPGQTGYIPGNTGYNPPGVPAYQSPAGQYGAPPAAGGDRRDPYYRPGNTSDYLPTGGTTSTAVPGAGAGAAYNAPSTGYPTTGSQPANLAAPQNANPIGASGAAAVYGGSTAGPTTTPPTVSYGSTGY